MKRLSNWSIVFAVIGYPIIFLFPSFFKSVRTTYDFRIRCVANWFVMQLRGHV